jgi:phosphoribosylformylglycinamidine synthase
VSGNVSLYNETNGQGILPTPTIGGVGLIDDWSKMARIGFAAAKKQAILLVGGPKQLGHASRPVRLHARHAWPHRRPAAARSTCYQERRSAISCVN